MNWKDFFKPTRFKIILFILLLIITLFIPKLDQGCVMTPNGVECYDVFAWGIGFPMFFGEHYSGDTISLEFYPTMLVANLIVYYLLSCVIIFFYEKRSKP